ncbi:class II aldolase/adducin family protein [Saccharomonospora azurea]|uniref:Ribulose-5-phosphate 4-epimerase-like epimerase or aldolase n=1 Tax=Saccharomonospora azurea NA-128 TaxID=882081 RepID=H8GDT9_9PSEU|nr:class II aldolase/adducin family protein [Saccharomonospora azurea]EHK88869.1 ribulose-5-phosphate 4-epimerase-like epimerase or aldolase [Saccharomonospora azurea SZMC 14600]EHY88883.1 ribulose-5-phosphate 4-epimerase-like epimerase or aldolase [Saccharomonospora azurea NA-128]
MLLAEHREAVCDYARRMVTDGLVVGTSGNISVREGDLVAVTPTGVDYASLRPEDVPVLRLDGSPVEGALRPTSEMPMHLAVYREAKDPDGADVAAVVHTHSTHAVAVSTLVDEVPAVHYMVAAIGSSVRVAPYATYGTQELADHMLTALDGRRGCVLGNHGTVTYGADLAAAYSRAQQLEWVCQVWLAARSVGSPRLLPGAEIEHVVDRLRGYGQK